MLFSPASCRLLLTTATVLFLSACSSLQQSSEELPNQQISDSEEISVSLHEYPDSDFHQVKASFTTDQPAELVFRVLSDLAETPIWFEYLQTLDTLEIYTPRSYLTRATLSSPWPFQNRDIINCVNTEFTPQEINIRLTDCHARYPEQEGYHRVKQSASRWLINKAEQGSIVHYTAWVEPGGTVPAFVYNALLPETTRKSMTKLRHIISEKQLSDYSY